MSSPCAVRFVHRDMENAGLRKDGMFYCTQGCANMGRHVPQGEPGKFVETDVDPYPAPDALAEDAKRLSELKEELATVKFPELELVDVKVAAVARAQIRRLVALITVYEECQARGRLFGGLR